MGPAPEQTRTQGTKTGNERSRASDSSLLDQSVRRPLERHVSRNSTNPDDIVFGPPRTAFSSSRGSKTQEHDKTTRDADGQARGAARNRGDTDGDRFRDTRSNHLRRRGEVDQDNDGWNMVKPRKSFGTEGAERFHGKMGGNFREDRRPPREGNKDDRDGARERPGRAFDSFTRERDAVESDGRSRNGLGRNKTDNWRATEGTDAPPPAPEKRDRDRTKSWRERDRDAEPPSDDRNAGRANDRRWARDRDHKPEREPEWLDEPAEAREAHTQQDFQKWMEQMKKAKSGSSTVNKPLADATPEAAKPSASTPTPTPAAEPGPDKFFLAFGGGKATSDGATPGEQKESAAAKTKASGKSSRFTSFFSQPQGDSRPRTEACTRLTGPPANEPLPAVAVAPAAAPSGLAALLGPTSSPGAAQGAAPEEERQAFKQLLAKLQKASMSATPPGPSPFAAPPAHGNPPDAKNSVLGPAEPFLHYGSSGVQRDGSLGRPPPQLPHQEILSPRPQPQSARPEQLLQDLVGHHQRVSSQGSASRNEPNAARNNSNTEFLMNLMRIAPDAQRQEHGRAPSQPQPQLASQLQKPSGLMPFGDREQEFGGRENRNHVRMQPPPGFPMDEAFHGAADRDARQNHPTQILQRPPPPGLDQMPPNWMSAGGQLPSLQQRGLMLPPPGLAGGMGVPNRNMPLPPMFPPNFPPGAMPPPPDAMAGMPPRSMPPPPPGFFNGPPHGFLPPGLGGFNGPPSGPEGFTGSPFEARGMPPPAGSNGRPANYGRP